MEAVHKQILPIQHNTFFKEPNRLQQYRRVFILMSHPSDYRYVNVQVRCTLC
jgi:alkyl hydroperoxide reductase subunit AhpC